MNPKSVVTCVLLPVYLLAVACGGGDAQPKLNLKNPVAITAADRAAAKEHMTTYCSTCHGTSGKGDTPTGKALTPNPRDWTDVEWQKKTTDDTIFTVISKGGAAVGLSPLMQPSPTYADKPAVVAALVELVRGFAGK